MTIEQIKPFIGLEVIVMAPPMVFRGTLKSVNDLHVTVQYGGTLSKVTIMRAAIKKITPLPAP